MNTPFAITLAVLVGGPMLALGVAALWDRYGPRPDADTSDERYAQQAEHARQRGLWLEREPSPYLRAHADIDAARERRESSTSHHPHTGRHDR